MAALSDRGASVVWRVGDRAHVFSDDRSHSSLAVISTVTYEEVDVIYEYRDIEGCSIPLSLLAPLEAFEIDYKKPTSLLDCKEQGNIILSQYKDAATAIKYYSNGIVSLHQYFRVSGESGVGAD